MTTRLSPLKLAAALTIFATVLAALASANPASAERPDVPASSCSWTGGTSADWHTSGNWATCGGGIPTGGDDVTIPNTGVTNEPALNTGNATVRTLTVAVGRTLTLSGTNNLSFNQGFSNAGLITGTGTLRANGTQSLAQTGTVNAALEVVTGTATASSATYSGTLLVDAGATFLTDCNNTVTVVGNVTVNGTLGVSCGGDLFIFKGAAFTNNGSVALPNVTFSRSGGQTISGTGTWTGANLTISSGSTTGTANPFTVAVTTLVVNSSGTLSVTNPLTFTGSTFSNGGSVVAATTFLLTGTVSLNNTGTFAGGGSLQTRGAIFLSQGGAFSVPVEVAAGTTTGSTGVYSGTLLVDAGASFSTDCNNTVTIIGNVTINGTLGVSCGGDLFIFKGAAFTNNGSVALPNVTFSRSGGQTISGTGTWTGANLTISSGSTTGTANPFTIAAGTLTVSAGGTLSVANPLTFTGSTLNNGGSIALGATLLLTGTISLNNTGSVSGGGTLQTGGAIFLSQGGAFSVPVEVATGTTTGSTGVYSGTLLVDLGATFRTDCNNTVTVIDNVTVNGTLGVSCGNDTFVFKGALFTNNGSVALPYVTFGRAGGQTISGSGTWTGSNLTISPGSTTGTANPFAIAAGTLTVSAGGTLSVTNPLTFTGGTVNNNGSVTVGATLLLTGSITFNNFGPGSVSGVGTLQTGGTIFLSQGGAFSVPVEVATGTTTGSTGVYSGTLLVDLGATFRADCNNTTTVAGNVTVNGTLGVSCGNDTFVFKGALFTNNGSVALPYVTFGRAGSQTISGSGTWTGTNLTIDTGSNTSTANALTIAAGTLVVNTGGTLNVTNPLTFTGSTVNNNGSVTVGATLLLTGSITFNNFATGSVSGGGSLQTRGTIFLSQSGAFSVPVEVATGTTAGSTGVYSGTLLVDLGATFRTDCNSTTTVAGDVTVNGTLGVSCGNDTFVFKGVSFTNNGSVALPNVTFGRAGNQSISGSGAWTGTNLTIDAASTTSLGSDIALAVTNFTVNGAFSGATFTTAFNGTTSLGGSGTVGFHGLTINATHSLNANGKNFAVSGDWTNNGSFTAAGNTVTFNGLASPAALQVYSGTTTFNNVTLASGAVVETGISFMNVSGVLAENGQARHTPASAAACGTGEFDAYNHATLTLNNCAGGLTSALVKSAAGGLFPDTTLGADPAYGSCSPSPQLTRRYWQIAPNVSGSADVLFAYNPAELVGAANTLGVYRCVNGLWVLQPVAPAYGVDGSGYNVVTATALALGGAYALGDAADLIVSKSASANPAIVGDVLTYTVVISNNGTFTATSVSITDVLPANAALLSTVPSQGACSGAGPITCGLNDVAGGGRITVTVAVRPLLVGVITNTVSATSNPADLNFANNNAVLAVVITPSVMITVADTSAATGIAVPTTALFTVTLSAASGAPITVTYSTADGTAVSGTDYTSTSGTLVFAPGATTAVISVTLATKTSPAPPKTFVMNLTGTVNGIIARGQATGTIINNTRQLFLPLIRR